MKKIFIKDIKLFFQIFFLVFSIFFVILNGGAFLNLIVYKSKELTSNIFNEITRPPLVLKNNKSLSLSSLEVNNEEKRTVPSENQQNQQNQQKKNNILFEFFDLILSSASQKATATNEIISIPLPQEAEKSNLLELPRFGIKAPILTVDQPDLTIIYAKLKQGVVLYPGSSLPGQGYSVIIGHSSQYPWQTGRYKSVFSLLNELKPGEKIYVFWEKQPLIFEVKDKKIFLPWPKGQDSTETIFPPSNEPTLILQSCWPVGVAYKRVAVKTILVK